MVEKKVLTDKESNKKIKDLKIELLKNPTKKASIKKEIARLLTMAHKGLVAEKESISSVSPRDKAPASSDENKVKLDGGNK